MEFDILLFCEKSLELLEILIPFLVFIADDYNG